MPASMDGFVLSQWLRANRPNVDVILLVESHVPLAKLQTSVTPADRKSVE